MKNIHYTNKPNLIVQVLQFPASTVHLISRKHIGTLALPTHRPVLIGLAMFGLLALTHQPDFFFLAGVPLICAFLHGLGNLSDRQMGIIHDPASPGESHVSEFLPNVPDYTLRVWIEPFIFAAFSVVAIYVGFWIAAIGMVFSAVAHHVVEKAKYQTEVSAFSSTPSAESRLQELEELFRSGHTSEREYNMKRQQILSEL